MKKACDTIKDEQAGFEMGYLRPEAEFILKKEVIRLGFAERSFQLVFLSSPAASCAAAEGVPAGFRFMLYLPKGDGLLGRKLSPVPFMRSLHEFNRFMFEMFGKGTSIY